MSRQSGTRPLPEYIRSLLHYNRKTGLLRWKIDRPPRGKKGKVAGCRRADGYIVVGISGGMYFAHRLAWVIVTGEWPAKQIDHKSLEAEDNRWKNLREATSSQNKHNRALQKNNTSGYKGVYKHSNCNRWGAMIQANNKKLHLGLFKTPEAASIAYRNAASILHQTFARF